MVLLSEYIDEIKIEYTVSTRVCTLLATRMAWVAVVLTKLSLVFLIRSGEMPLRRTRTLLSNSYRFTLLVRHLISINNLLQRFREHASLCLYLTWNWQLHIDIGINGGINDWGNEDSESVSLIIEHTKSSRTTNEILESFPQCSNYKISCSDLFFFSAYLLFHHTTLKVSLSTFSVCWPCRSVCCTT